MKAPNLENDFVKLSLLDLSNYKHLLDVSQQENLIQFSPSDISTPEKLKDYVQTAVDGYYHKTTIPFLIFDKTKNEYAGSTRFGSINWKNKVLYQFNHNMTHINRFFFTDISLKNKTITNAILIFFVLFHQKIIQFIYA